MAMKGAPQPPWVKAAHLASGQVLDLRRIQELAAEAGRLRSARAVPGHGDPTAERPADRIDLARRDVERDAVERGAPRAWVARARAAGREGRPWSPTQTFPTPLWVPQRGSWPRVRADRAAVIEMVALAVVRERHLGIDDIAGDPDSVASRQLRRNAVAAYVRAQVTAATLSKPPTRDVPAWKPDTGMLAAAIENHIGEPTGEVVAAWREYTTPRIADTLRSSVIGLRRRRGAPTLTEPDGHTAPVNELFATARELTADLHDSVTQPGVGAALEAALPPELSHAWDTTHDPTPAPGMDDHGMDPAQPPVPGAEP
ncbi:hypothetical protein [Nocardia puris]|uniref:Uncharacterized protein n=1 Tax=Nocardia puris TaxID=208602 RepID=A0A366D777_9NOCA|nr:hypothetical protein [Nocardia puris]RBO85304.1 hypothetical protein DFR74_115152 [Nocardia puris]